ncbi:DUF5412 domain-containing protein [Irregularibacter muris]|uniref:DUF5412 domain-containing protein n=1 Tax=Irregularibacter muris TaxID=1796619 RepID=A0AAE3HDT7_9FIRM|nr:DUF5412 domain-containing protein [Irregularibacter muris]MCR1898617.1 DUF5412 domain-containing protein [Irregularibacter muris]
MRKRLLIIFVVIITFLAYGIYWAFFDINRLEKGELISQVHSPDETYTIKAYLINGGATTSYAIRGELNFNKYRKKPKNIYWSYREENAVIVWVDDDTVIINGIQLNVPNEKFDFRRKK